VSVSPAEGVVVALGGGLAAVRVDGEERVAKLAGRLAQRPVVGDRVDVLLEPDGGARIDRIHPRRTTLQRLQRLGRGAQPLVANADRLLIVAAAAHPPLRRGLVDRLLVAAYAGGLHAGLVITKADLDDAPEAPADVLADYAAVGYPGVAIDARTEAGIAAVRALADGAVTILAGHSGVGKSTLVNGLVGSGQATGAVNEVIGRGRHTTTAARLLRGNGVVIVDTPGIRGFALAGIAPEALADAFPEIAALAPACRFRGCLHVGEAGCAVAGAVDERRLASYRKLLGELRGDDADA
jgi:ribosome biogenesis GTPase